MEDSPPIPLIEPQQPPPSSADDLLTVDEVAAILRMHPGSVRRLIQKGKIPARKLGYKSVRILRSSVAAIMLDADLNANDGTSGTGESGELLKRAAYVLRLAREVMPSNWDVPYQDTARYEDLATELERTAAYWGSRNIPGEVRLKTEKSAARLRELTGRPMPSPDNDDADYGDEDE